MQAARDARSLLKPEELGEFIAESVAVYQSLTSQQTNGHTVMAPTPTQTTIPTVADEPRMTLRQMITKALVMRASLGMGDIAEAVQRMQPDAKYVSIASEIKRMKNETPPLIVEVARNEKGHAIYALTKEGRD